MKIALIFAMLLLSGCKDYVYQSICADEAPLFTMQRYLDQKSGNTPEARVTALKEEGWELVSVGPQPGCSQYLTFRMDRADLLQARGTVR